MMSYARGTGLAVAMLLAGCGEPISTCKSDADCDENASCVHRLCVWSDAPDVVVTTDRQEATLGEPVRIDASASAAPNGAKLAFSFRVEPEGAALLEVEDAVAILRRRVAHQDVEVVVTATTSAGSRAERRVTVAARNSAPLVEITAEPQPFQPGEKVTLVAASSDVDGDELTFEWELESAVGALAAQGPSASLTTSPGVETVSYPVLVRVRDGRGGETESRAVLQPRNAAPEVVVGAGEADHHCEGDPLVCRAIVDLPIEIKDTNGFSVTNRLVDERPDVGHSFVVSAGGVQQLELTCSPACKLAGSWTVEVTAVDVLGASSTQTLPVTVRNRPPQVRAHDGSFLQHGARIEDGEHVYFVERPSGAVLVYDDPDGDPIAPGSVRWTSASDVVEFEDPASIDTRIEAAGRIADLAAIDAAVVVADINGAEVADRAALPVGNTAPTVTWGGDTREGHAFVRKETDGTRIYRKEISLVSLEASDHDGDPLTVEMVLDPVDPAAAGQILRIYEDGGGWFIEGMGPAFIGADYRVIARVTDAWGAMENSTSTVKVSNRPPVLTTGGTSRTFSEGRQCQRFTCCTVEGPGTCLEASDRVATEWSTSPPISGPLEVSDELLAVDPDGDPIDLEVAFGSRNRINAYARQGNTWVKQASNPCWSSADTWHCPVRVQLRGYVDPVGLGHGCELPQGTPVGASVQASARASDGLGGRSSAKSWNYYTVDSPSDESCP